MSDPYASLACILSQDAKFVKGPQDTPETGTRLKDTHIMLALYNIFIL